MVFRHRLIRLIQIVSDIAGVVEPSERWVLRNGLGFGRTTGQQHQNNDRPPHGRTSAGDRRRGSGAAEPDNGQVWRNWSRAFSSCAAASCDWVNSAGRPAAVVPKSRVMAGSRGVALARSWVAFWVDSSAASARCSKAGTPSGPLTVAVMPLTSASEALSWSVAAFILTSVCDN